MFVKGTHDRNKIYGFQKRSFEGPNRSKSRPFLSKLTSYSRQDPTTHLIFYYDFKQNTDTSSKDMRTIVYCENIKHDMRKPNQSLLNLAS